MWKDYEIIATGDGMKLEKWANQILLRPDPQIIWKAQSNLYEYKGLSAYYDRHNTGGGKWTFLKKMPEYWTVSWNDLKFKICIKIKERRDIDNESDFTYMAYYSILVFNKTH